MKHPGFYVGNDRYRGHCSKCNARPTVIGSTLCDTHYRERFARLSPVALRSAQVRRERYPERHIPVDADLFWRATAHRMVQYAIKRGILPSLDNSIACVDCGKPAKCYEHRDYSRPLDVEPVCRSCNRMRGSATYPKAIQFVRILEHEQAA